MSQFSQQIRAEYDPKYTAEQYINVANCVAPLLETFEDGIAASYQYSNDNKQSKEVKAFAKLSGRDWTYYIKSLRISFGRNTDNIEDLKKVHVKPEIPSIDSLKTEDEFHQDSNGTNIDLGPAKTVSRKHGAIEFNRETGNWDLIISGRNGAKLNYKKIKKGSLNKPILLNSGDIIDIGGVQMIFVLPDHVPIISQKSLKYIMPKIIAHYGVSGNNNPLLQDMIEAQVSPKETAQEETTNVNITETEVAKQPENEIANEEGTLAPEPSESNPAKKDQTIQSTAEKSVDIPANPIDTSESNSNEDKRPIEEEPEIPRKKFRISSINSADQYKSKSLKEVVPETIVERPKSPAVLSTQTVGTPIPNNAKDIVNNNTMSDNRQESPANIESRQPEETKIVTKIAQISHTVPSKEASPSGDAELAIRTQRNTLPAPYGSLIAEGILSTEEGVISLSELYDYLKNKYAYFGATTANWQNSVRHTLSVNPAFSKIARKKVNATGKGMVWSIDQEYREAFLKKWGLGYAQHNRKNPAVDTQLIQYLTKHKSLPEPYDNKIRPSEIRMQDMSQANGLSLEMRKDSRYYA